MNNKILSVILVTGIATTGFAGISAADQGLFGEQIEQRVDALEAQFDRDDHERKSQFGKRKGLKHLTQEEKELLESMSDEEKREFFEEKKSEMMAQKQERKAIIDKLVAGESLTAAEEALRIEMLGKLSDNEKKYRKSGSEIIEKILAGDELSAEELAEFENMKAKKQERMEKREQIQAIKTKLDAGEEITPEEQDLLDEAKSYKKYHKRGYYHKGY